MPDAVKNNYQNVMSALVFLSAKSVELRQKLLAGGKAEMAEVEDDGERAIVEDEDDIEIDIDSDEEGDDWCPEDDEGEDRENLYDSPLDALDEVLFFCEQLQKIE